MRKTIWVILCLIMVLCVSACATPASEQELTEREKYTMTYEKAIKMLGGTLSEETINDESYSSRPWITDRAQLPGSDIWVSRDALKKRFYAYELQLGEALDLTAQDVIDLYSTPNAEKQAEFDKLVDWYREEGASLYVSEYAGFGGATYRLYHRSHEEPFIDKKITMYTADEVYALVRWGLENIDYGYIEEVLSNPDADYYDLSYVKYLYHLGLIDNYGKPVADQQAAAD